MKINEIEVWRQALTYGLDNHPVINYASIENSRAVNDAIISAFVAGVRYAEDHP